MSDLLGTGAALGLLGGIGWCLIWLGLPMHRRPGLADRVLPYLRDSARPSSLLSPATASVGPVRTFGRLLLARLGGLVERVLGGAPSVRRRLLRAGREPDVERFRAEQVLWAAICVAGALGLVVLGYLVGDGNALISLLVLVIAAVLGVTGRDWWLSHQVRQREQRMLMEFPTIAELLALSVSAGEGATGALERVAALSQGELSLELRRCLADARAGANLPMALTGLADRTGLPPLARFVDGMIVAVERGTPLGEVLRAQAQDVREAGRRAVMEEAGKREIAMMVPVVFLILPVTVVFAIFPGLSFLNLDM